MPPQPTRTHSPASDPAVLKAVTRSVARRGYRATSVADVIELAGMGRNSFYARFRNKEQCFVAAYDGMLAQAVAEFAGAARRLGSPEERIEAPFGALLRVVAREPEAARAALLESHAAGDAARAQRDRAMGAFAAHVRRALAGRDDGAGPRPSRAARGATADAIPAAICGAVETLLIARVREGRHDELPDLSAPLAAWAASYEPLLAPGAPPIPEPAPRLPSRRRGQAPGTLIPAGPSGRTGLPPGPKREPRDFIASNVRDRLLDAIARIAARDGYDALTVASVVTEATTSRRSFYDHFSSIPEAFRSAVLLGAEGAMGATLPAYATRADWSEAIVAGIAAFCGFLAEEEPFAVTGLVEVLAAGPEAIEVRDQALGALAALIADAYRRAPNAPHAEREPGGPAARPDAPVALIAELVAGATFALCANQIRMGRTEELPDLVPLLGVLALVPLTGADDGVAAVQAAIAAA